MDWNSRQKICSPRRCGQFGTLGSTQRPFVQELEVFSQKVFFLKIPICCVCTLLWGQHLEPLSPTVVYPPVPPFGAASGTLEMQYEGKTSFLSENKHKLHFWSYSAWTSIFMTQFVRLLYYLWLFVISSTSGPPPCSELPLLSKCKPFFSISIPHSCQQTSWTAFVLYWATHRVRPVSHPLLKGF